MQETMTDKKQYRYVPVRRLTDEEIEALPAFIETRAAAGIVGHSIPWVQRRIKDGTLRATKLGGHNWRIPKAGVLSLLDIG